MQLLDKPLKDKKFFIVAGEHGAKNERQSITRYFEQLGAKQTFVESAADIDVYFGGSDISTTLYGQENKWSHTPNIERDGEEVTHYLLRQQAQKPVLSVGICRGGQLLHVMNGGTLYQHVSGHNGGKHSSTFNLKSGTREGVEVNSYHHQQMIFPLNNLRGNQPKLVGYTTNKVATERKTCGPHDPSSPEIECIYYAKTKALCFQPHPEWDISGPTDSIFREILKEVL